MFSIPITIVTRTDEAVIPLDVTIDIDKIAVVKPLLDKCTTSSVESHQLYDLVPATELVLLDGRKLPVLEPAAIINRYLTAYQQFDHFYTAPATPARKPDTPERGVVIPLFRTSPCATSEASTPA